MALLAGAICGMRNDSCSRKHKYARTSHGMASESLSRGVDLIFATDFCFIKQEHGPPRGSKQAKTDVLLTTVLGPRHTSRCRLLLFFVSNENRLKTPRRRAETLNLGLGGRSAAVLTIPC